MSADLHIHVMTDEISEQDLADFFSHTLGSKWFRWRGGRLPQGSEAELALFHKLSETPQVHVGEVSWLKAWIAPEAADEFVPAPVHAVHDIIGEELPVIDEDLISRVAGAFDVPNQTDYTVDDGREVIAFLREHLGQRVFTVSW